MQKDTAGQKKIRIPFDTSSVSLFHTLRFESSRSLRHPTFLTFALSITDVSLYPDYLRITFISGWDQVTVTGSPIIITMGDGSVRSSQVCTEPESRARREGDRESQSGAWSGPGARTGTEGRPTLESSLLDSG